MIPQTLYDMLRDSHAVHVEDDGTTPLYIDRHPVHEVTSPGMAAAAAIAGHFVDVRSWR